MLSRRELLRLAGTGLVAGPLSRPFALLAVHNSRESAGFAVPRKAMRCINVVNFIRGVEPRFKTDLLLPVERQMEIILEHQLPATWLLQFDALASGPFVEYLKQHMTRDHEVGTWFEMNELHCRAAGVEWRGRPGWEWDYNPSVAFTLGYSKEERIKLADTAMGEFKRICGHYPKAVASWNLDAITMAHLADRYGVDAFAVCRDQIATDGFTIWGAPIAGYYPSRSNCWSPAVDAKNQISAPIFRMLGQDPVYYYQREWTAPGGRRLRPPDTMEPVWASGQDPTFVREFLHMIEEGASLDFAYAQLGQENSFPWSQQEPGYAPQMKALAELRKRGVVHVETMGESGRRFKSVFRQTPAQAQVMLADPYGNTDPPCASIWYQSRFYRANLHIRGDLPYFRDLTVYSDHLAQPYLDRPARVSDVEQRMPAIVDGYHWSKHPGSAGEESAGGYFMSGNNRLRLSGKPEVREEESTLGADLPIGAQGALHVRFEERSISVRGPRDLAISFEWDKGKTALTQIEPDRLHYRWQGLDYSVWIRSGRATETSAGVRLHSRSGELRWDLGQ